MGLKSNPQGIEAPESPPGTVVSGVEERARPPLWLATAALTAAMEIPAIFCRFALGWTSTEATASIVGRLTLGVRIHHGYFFVLFLAAAWWLWYRRPVLARWVLAFGLALLLSDVVHHFLVLWPLTGSPDWDWRYGG